MLGAPAEDTIWNVKEFRIKKTTLNAFIGCLVSTPALEVCLEYLTPAAPIDLKWECQHDYVSCGSYPIVYNAYGVQTSETDSK
jgi:hypothetical protein